MSRNKTANDNRITFMSRADAKKYNMRYYIGGHCKHCKQQKTIRYTVNGCCVNCNGKTQGG